MTPPTNSTDDLIDGYTLDQLSDYLDSGMAPPDPAIDASPACQIVLDSLRSIHAASQTMLDVEAANEPPASVNWIAAILATISLDTRAGTTIPVASTHPDLQITITEGALRGLIRAAGDQTPGVLVGRCIFIGDLTLVGAPLTVEVDAAIFWGHNIPATSAALQHAIQSAIAAQTNLNVTTINITVHDVHQP